MKEEKEEACLVKDERNLLRNANIYKNKAREWNISNLISIYLTMMKRIRKEFVRRRELATEFYAVCREKNV